PEECYFQPSFACKSAFLKDAGANSYDFELVVQNEMGFEMFIESVNITSEAMGSGYSDVFSVQWSNSAGAYQYGAGISSGLPVGGLFINDGSAETMNIRITPPVQGPRAGDLEKMKVTIVYRNCDVANLALCTTNGAPHTIIGSISTRVN
ncbi:MAG: hypothetical protein ABIH99_02270, partial [Candidatus Micrarchaeota archaeon]